MENIKIKRKLFEIKEEISLDMFVGEYKGKLYEICKYDPNSTEDKDLIFSIKKINSSGVKSPKLVIVDKKTGYYVREKLNGEKCSDFLAREDFTDELYEKLFKTSYVARTSQMTLNYEPDKWMIVNGELYYTYPIFIRYQKEKDLAEHYIRLWFNTKELANFLGKIGVSYDKNRIKAEYLTNKEIVLKVCKFYR